MKGSRFLCHIGNIGSVGTRLHPLPPLRTQNTEPMKNPDRDEEHKRRREAGDSDAGPDGKAVAAALYGGDTSALTGGDEEDDDETEPTLFDNETDQGATAMPHPSKRKGNRFERSVVKAAEQAGLEAERAFASDGRSLGETEATDVLVRHPEANISDCTRLQCKRRKSVAKYLTCENADVTVIREDYGDPLAVVPLDVLFRLLSERAETGV